MYKTILLQRKHLCAKLGYVAAFHALDKQTIIFVIYYFIHPNNVALIRKLFKWKKDVFILQFKILSTYRQTSKGVFVCVCCLLNRCIQCALKETSEETRGDKQSPLLFSFWRSFHLFCSVITLQSVSDSMSSCFSPTLSVSCGADTNDGSVSAQSAVTETSHNLSLAVSHCMHHHLLSPSCLSHHPSLCLLC